jgi:hypothetical protein
MGFEMELVVGERTGDRLPWTVIYAGAAGRQERKYELVVRDAAKGRYAIDEKQGIVIEMASLGEGLYGHFEVEGMQLSVAYRPEFGGGEGEGKGKVGVPTAIEVEIVTTRADGVTVTGGANGGPEVRTFAPVSVQRARLVKVVAEAAPKAPAGTGEEGSKERRGAL